MNLELFFTKGLIANQKKWLRHYYKLYKLCKRGKDRTLDINIETENHHIFPKCLGGRNTKDNMVRLTCSEHFIAHQLLAKVFPKNYKLMLGAATMSTGTARTPGRINNKRYAWIRTALSKAMKGKTKENDERAAKISKAHSGRTKENDESKRRGAEKLRGRTKDNDEGYAKIAKAVAQTLTGRNAKEYDYLRVAGKKRGAQFKGRNKSTHSGTAAQAKKISGANHPNAMIWHLEAPTGEQFTITDLPAFCKEHDLPYSSIQAKGLHSIDKPLRQGRGKGWRVLSRQPKAQ